MRIRPSWAPSTKTPFSCINLWRIVIVECIGQVNKHFLIFSCQQIAFSSRSLYNHRNFPWQRSYLLPTEKNQEKLINHCRSTIINPYDVWYCSARIDIQIKNTKVPIHVVFYKSLAVYSISTRVNINQHKKVMRKNV